MVMVRFEDIWHHRRGARLLSVGWDRRGACDDRVDGERPQAVRRDHGAGWGGPDGGPRRDRRAARAQRGGQDDDLRAAAWPGAPHGGTGERARRTARRQPAPGGRHAAVRRPARAAAGGRARAPHRARLPPAHAHRGRSQAHRPHRPGPPSGDRAVRRGASAVAVGDDARGRARAAAARRAHGRHGRHLPANLLAARPCERGRGGHPPLRHPRPRRGRGGGRSRRRPRQWPRARRRTTGRPRRRRPRPPRGRLHHSHRGVRPSPGRIVTMTPTAPARTVPGATPPRAGGALRLLALHALLELRSSFRSTEFAVGAMAVPVLLYAMFGLPNAGEKLPGGTRVGLAMLVSIGCYGVVSLAIFTFGEDVAKERGRGWPRTLAATPFPTWEIGRASCRERVSVEEVNI